MAKPIITIIGLGMRGASMGLALQREESNFEIVGHDKDSDATQIAEHSAVHRTEWNLFRACEGADMIITTVPLNELPELYKLLGEELKPGTLVFGMSTLLQPTLEAAAEHLPHGFHFVAGHPILAGVGSSMTVRADLFDEVTFCLAPGLQTEPGAVQLASDFVERVQATPLFVDAHEHDGIIAGVEQLPQIMAAALMQVSTSAAGWREARRLAGRQFAEATDLGHNAEQLYRSLSFNRDNLLYRIDRVQDELARWRQLIADDNATESTVQEIDSKAGGAEASDTEKNKDNTESEAKQPLLAALEKAVNSRVAWEAQATIKNWEEMPTASESDAAGGGGLFRQMFLGGIGGGRNKSNNR